MRTGELAQPGELLDYKIGRGGIRLPELADHKGPAAATHYYLQSLFDLNEEFVGRDYESSDEGFRLPAYQDKPEVVITRGLALLSRNDYRVYIRRAPLSADIVPLVSHSRRDEVPLLRASGDGWYAGVHHIAFNGEECADSDRDWGSLASRPDLIEEVKQKLPTCQQALEAFLELVS